MTLKWIQRRYEDCMNQTAVFIHTKKAPESSLLVVDQSHLRSQLALAQTY